MKTKVILLFFFLISLFNLSFAKTDLLTKPFFKPSLENKRKPKYVRGIHINGWSAGSGEYRKKLAKMIEETDINTVVIAVKEYNGEVYIPGVKKAVEFGAYRDAMPDIKKYVKRLQNKGVYVVARIVLFKDDIAARKSPDWAVKTPYGDLWLDNRKQAWVDPYNSEVWEYNFSIIERCIELGFDEIQFDYIRFPSDGDISLCRYLKPHSSKSAVENISNFLEEAELSFKIRRGIPISIDVFGLTTSARTDMGIGQILTEMQKYVDYVSPMVYPSHYAANAYGIENPDSYPYTTVFNAMRDAKNRLLNDSKKLRPYLQDFTVEYPYTEQEVLEQIRACNENGVYEWILWNPRSVYSYKKGTRDSEKGTREEKQNPKSQIINPKSKIQKQTTDYRLQTTDKKVDVIAAEVKQSDNRIENRELGIEGVEESPETVEGIATETSSPRNDNNVAVIRSSYSVSSPLNDNTEEIEIKNSEPRIIRKTIIKKVNNNL